jgi:hypothetical protein
VQLPERSPCVCGRCLSPGIVDQSVTMKPVSSSRAGPTPGIGGPMGAPIDASAAPTRCSRTSDISLWRHFPTLAITGCGHSQTTVLFDSWMRIGWSVW